MKSKKTRFERLSAKPESIQKTSRVDEAALRSKKIDPEILRITEESMKKNSKLLEMLKDS